MPENKVSDGGRTKDRTWDPYDVNAIPNAAKRATARACAVQHGGTVSERVENETGSTRKSRASLPIGGTTGLCQQSTAAIDEAATWYAANDSLCERPIIPALRRRFGLTAHEAVMALREARK